MTTDRAVIIDFLAISGPLVSMKSAHTFPEKGHNWQKWTHLPSTRLLQRMDYDQLPDSQFLSLASSEDVQRKADLYNKQLIACLHARLRMFIASVFGLSVGPARGSGGFAYEDSAVLYSDDGGNEHYGMLYWGGNNGTFYIQISGKGCAHVFSGTTPENIYKWLKHLDITSIKRIDLATDDYDGIFTCNHALEAYKDDAFYNGAGPKPKIGYSNEIDSDGCFTKEIVNVGSRQSRIYWRVYNKALEQKVTGTWYRSEAELKGVPCEVLLNIEGTYTSLCPFAASINPTKPESIPALLGRKAVDSIEAKVKWLRKQASSTISKVISFFEGDVDAALSMILREEHLNNSQIKFDIPPVYQTLIIEKVRNIPCPF